MLAVRNNLIGLFLAPDEFLVIKYRGNEFRVFPGIKTKFSIGEGSLWLAFKPDGCPFWQMELGNRFEEVEFRMYGKMIKCMRRDFPYKPTNNFIVYDETKAASV